MSRIDVLIDVLAAMLALVAIFVAAAVIDYLCSVGKR